MTNEQEKDFVYMQTDIQEIKKQGDNLDTKLDTCIRLLQGDPANPFDSGLLGFMHEIKKEIAELKEFKKKAIWIGIGMGIPGGYGAIVIISDMIRKITTH